MLLCRKKGACLGKQTLVPILIGASAGFLGGPLGGGGGIILVPAMVAFLSLTQKEAHGTSLGVIVLLALSGAIQYALHGNVNWVLAGGLAIGGAIGAILGAKLMMRVPTRRLRQGFGVLLLASAVLMFIR